MYEPLRNRNFARCGFCPCTEESFTIPFGKASSVSPFPDGKAIEVSVSRANVNLEAGKFPCAWGFNGWLVPQVVRRLRGTMRKDCISSLKYCRQLISGRLGKVSMFLMSYRFGLRDVFRVRARAPELWSASGANDF
ncbi:predicted protein [Histoplasma capsulatum var. duboisii H88]|uniref:Predicted protein n=1 Tax=Ajellomyces capsulatus (strain H88) TaxID=544711 RepID=F0URG0_AJEC8|nr:predicted protein [Histoplasma capsulatum var. duboisii H88]